MSKTKTKNVLDETILKQLEKKAKNLYQHKYQHYCFECECHPDDHPEELEKQMEELHLDD